MRRTLITGILLGVIALPLCAQRRWVSSPHAGGSVGFRGSHTGFAVHSGPAFRGGMRFSSPARFGAGISFGHNPRVRVFVNPRPIAHPRRWSVYPYRYSPSYVYPYVAYPAYPLSYYDAYDYMAVPARPYPVYVYGYASGDGNYPEEGLAEQMRRQRVGIYAQPEATEPPRPQPIPEASTLPERQLPLTVLIYRDGRRTEVRNYAIVGQTLWIFSEERSQKVPLAQLDLDATRRANDERGSEFAAPAKP